MQQKKMQFVCKPGSVEVDHLSGVVFTHNLYLPTHPAATFVAWKRVTSQPGFIWHFNP